MYPRLYRLTAYLGLMTFSASFIMGWRWDPTNYPGFYYVNLILFALFVFVHIAMTMPRVKKKLYGNPESTERERQIYITVAVASWVLLYAVHPALPGWGFHAPVWMQYIGLCVVLLSVVGFYEFATFDLLDKVVAVPGCGVSHSVGKETPLMTDGSYANVRHPMYRAAFFICFGSLLIHPNASQFFFASLTALTFLAFIPFEERQLIRARGAEYVDYKRKVPYRVFRGIW